LPLIPTSCSGAASGWATYTSASRTRTKDARVPVGGGGSPLIVVAAGS
jgi:hypothetical protein